MNEIKQVLLFKYNDNSLDKTYRLIEQAKKYNISKIFIVGDTSEVKKSANVELLKSSCLEKDYLLELGLKQVTEPFVTFDSSMILENDLVKYVLGADFDGKNVMFTSKKLTDNFFVTSDDYANVTNISQDSCYENCFTNILRISNVDAFKIHYKDCNLIQEINFIQTGIEPFYFSTNANDIDTKCDYVSIFKDISFVDISKLIRIEDHNENRVNELKNNILTENKWTQPIIVEKNDFMILDGHHRFEVAKLLNLKKIPAILVDYNDIDVWTLRKEIPISQQLVRTNAVTNNQIYPYKTVKHKFPFIVPTTNYMLGELKND